MFLHNKMNPNRSIFNLIYKYILPRKQSTALDNEELSPLLNNTYFSIAAILKNEAPYIKEWIEYHRIIGAERFYLYDNESDDNIVSILEPYIKKNIVIYKKVIGKGMQIPVYNDVIVKTKNKTKWLALIDIDEFIVPKIDNSIINLLKNFEKYPAIGVNWIKFDSNGHLNKQEGLVIENYTRTYANSNHEENLHIKSIIQPKRVWCCGNPHYCFYNWYNLAVDENYNFIIGPFTLTNKTEKIQINHYFTKSREEYITKIERGKATGDGKYTLLEENINFPQTKQDTSILKFVDTLKNRIN